MERKFSAGAMGALWLLFTPPWLTCCSLDIKGTADSAASDEEIDRDAAAEDGIEIEAVDTPDGADPDVPDDGLDVPGDDLPADTLTDPDAADPVEDVAVEDFVEREPRDDWLAGWARRVRMTIDSTDIDADLADFPVLVHISASSGRGGDDLSFVFTELSSDLLRKRIAVTKSDGISQCFVEIERWNGSGREAWLWVKAPSIDDETDTDLYLYFDAGHPDNIDYAGDPGSAAAENVWDGNFTFVCHMQDDLEVMGARDSTSNHNHGTKGEPDCPQEVRAMMGRGLEWDNSCGNEFVSVPDSASLDMGSRFSAEVWVNYTKGVTPNDYERMLNKKNEYHNPNGWEFSLELGQDQRLTARGSSSVGASGIVNFVDSWAAGGWHQVVVTYDGARVNGYRDGVFRDWHSITSVSNNNRNLFIGRYGASLSNKWFGLMDEVRLSNIIRADAWIKASNESGRDDLIEFGIEELY
ncbi:MAG: LamG domain-containing protein [Pseudomonadota bacterium]